MKSLGQERKSLSLLIYKTKFPTNVKIYGLWLCLTQPQSLISTSTLTLTLRFMFMFYA